MRLPVIKPCLGLAASLALFCASSSSAALFVQEVPFSFSASGTTATAPLTDAGDFTASFNPFNASLGTLNSFRVEWNVAYQMNFTNSVNGGNGSISASGTYYLGGLGYSGNGGGDGDSGNAGVPLEAGFGVLGDTLFSTSSITYNPAILALVTGPDSFDAVWDSSTTPYFEGVAGWSATATGSVKLTYDYTPVPEPADAGIAAAFVAAGVAVGFRRMKRR
jgi:hypothetical protein